MATLIKVKCPRCDKFLYNTTQEQLDEAYEEAKNSCYVPHDYHEHCPAQYQQFDWVKALYHPKRTDDLVDGTKKHIDRPFMFQAIWIVEDGEYEGQWAFMPYTMNKEPIINFGWVPQQDLSVYHRF